MSVELRRAEEGGMISSYLTGWVCSVRVSRWILDTYDLSAVFCFFHVLTRYLRGFISIRNQCKATYITSWTSQFHQRFNNIRTAVACTDKVRRKLHNHPPWRLREIPRLTCQRSPTLHFGLDSHVCTPLTHALPHAPIKHARKRVCHTIFHRRLTYPAENRIPLPLPLHCLPCRSHNYRGKKTSKGKRPRENIFPRVGGWAGGHCSTKGNSLDVCETPVFLLLLLVAKIGLPLKSL